ncbi:MAG: DUF1349 domain-containing protein [Bacteroidota bacterium]|jgi:regulation of enolase protein 1 (concanavalin A-like superfamily)
MKKLFLIIALYFIFPIGILVAQETKDEASLLMQLDRDVNKAPAEKGIDGWVAYFAPNGSMLGYTKQPTTGSVKISTIPKEIIWYNQPIDWKVVGNSFTINAGKGSRLFIDPQHDIYAITAPMALFVPDSNFLFSCKVSVAFKTVFDAGVLVIYGSNNQWAKLCFEYSPQHKPMIVSVVNNKISDDCNHIAIQENNVFIRIAGMGNGSYAFHYSFDGKYWNLARYFCLDQKESLKIGFLSQSPKGESCESTFSEIKYSIKKLIDFRNGD